MKIAVDAREIVGQIAGKGRYTVEVIKGLATIDQENEYFLYSKQPLDIELPRNFTPILIGGLPGLRQLWLAFDAKKRGCQLLFSPTGYLPVVFSLIPSIVVVHDLAVFLSKEAKPALKTLIAERLLLGSAVRRARHIISVSHSTKHDLEELFKVPAKKMTVTQLGYDRSLYSTKKTNDDEVLKTYNLKPGYLLFLGTLEPRKNIVGILKAYAQLPAELRQQHRLVIGGKKGWYYDSIFTTVEDLKLQDEVQFLGRVPDEHLPTLYRNATIFLFPSFYEGFGLPPLEALACGTPVISSNVSSLPEVVGQAGLLIDPHNPDTIAQAMQQLLTDTKRYEQIKANTVQQADHFNWQQTAQATLAIFKQIV